MSGWDEGAIFYSDQAQFPRGGSGGGGDSEQGASRHTVLRKFKEFIRSYARKDQPNVFLYRESLVQNPKFLLVDLADLCKYDNLDELLRTSPTDYLPLVSLLSLYIYLHIVQMVTEPLKPKRRPLYALGSLLFWYRL